MHVAYVLVLAPHAQQEDGLLLGRPHARLRLCVQVHGAAARRAHEALRLALAHARGEVAQREVQPDARPRAAAHQAGGGAHGRLGLEQLVDADGGGHRVCRGEHVVVVREQQLQRHLGRELVRRARGRVELGRGAQVGLHVEPLDVSLGGAPHERLRPLAALLGQGASGLAVERHLVEVAERRLEAPHAVLEDGEARAERAERWPAQVLLLLLELLHAARLAQLAARQVLGVALLAVRQPRARRVARRLVGLLRLGGSQWPQGAPPLALLAPLAATRRLPGGRGPLTWPVPLRHVALLRHLAAAALHVGVEAAHPPRRLLQLGSQAARAAVQLAKLSALLALDPARHVEAEEAERQLLRALARAPGLLRRRCVRHAVDHLAVVGDGVAQPRKLARVGLRRLLDARVRAEQALLARVLDHRLPLVRAARLAHALEARLVLGREDRSQHRGLARAGRAAGLGFDRAARRSGRLRLRGALPRRGAS